MTTQEIINLLYGVLEDQKRFHKSNDWEKQEAMISGAEDIMLREMGRLSALIVGLEREA